MSELPEKLPPELSVGVIGIGAFGSKIALRLLWTDFPGLQIYDIDDLTPRHVRGVIRSCRIATHGATISA